MEYVAEVFVLVLGAVLLIGLITFLLSFRFNRSGISKDYAEQIVMRRFAHGRVIGARFLREGSRWYWELDVLDQGQINRVAVDARSSVIAKVRPIAGKPYATGDTRMLGQRAPNGT